MKPIDQPAYPQPVTFSPDGAAVFPRDYGYGFDGMTLRDRFAIAALNQRKALSFGNWYAADAAREAYEIADAMLIERQTKRGDT